MEADSAENVTPIKPRRGGGGSRSPVDVALDSAGLGSRVNRALDTGHGGIPCLVYISGLELDLNYLPALQNRRTTLSSVKARC